ncbi:MAG: hypothetical protein ACFFEN_14915 [Candidatus Thorarchaeota archaeon]
MYKKGIHTEYEIPNIDWDGENDLNTMTTWMIKDKGTFPSVDDLFIEAEKEFEEIPIELRNSLLNQTKEFIDQIRQL